MREDRDLNKYVVGRVRITEYERSWGTREGERYWQIEEVPFVDGAPRLVRWRTNGVRDWPDEAEPRRLPEYIEGPQWPSEAWALLAAAAAYHDGGTDLGKYQNQVAFAGKLIDLPDDGW